VSDTFEALGVSSVETLSQDTQYDTATNSGRPRVGNTLIVLSNYKHNIGEVPIRIINRQTLETLADLPPLGTSVDADGLVLSDDESMLAVGHGYSGDSSTSGLLRVYRLNETGMPHTQPTAAFQYVRNLRTLNFSADGEYLVACRRVPDVVCYGRTEYPITVYKTPGMTVYKRWTGAISLAIRSTARVGSKLFLAREVSQFTNTTAGFPPLAVLDFDSGELRYGPVCRRPDGKLFKLSIKNIAYDAWDNRLYIHNSETDDGVFWHYLQLDDIDSGYYPLYGVPNIAYDANLQVLQQGRGEIQGTVKDASNQPAARTVQALAKAPIACVAQDVSNAQTGEYRLLLENREPVDVVFRAKEGENLNDLFYAKVKPADAGSPPVAPPIPDWVAFNDAAAETAYYGWVDNWVKGIVPPENRPRAETFKLMGAADELGRGSHWVWVLPFEGANWSDGSWECVKDETGKPHMSQGTFGAKRYHGGGYWEWVIEDVIANGEVVGTSSYWDWVAYTHPSQSFHQTENCYMHLEDGTKWLWSVENEAWEKFGTGIPAPQWWVDGNYGEWPPAPPAWWGNEEHEDYPHSNYAWWGAETAANWPPVRPDGISEEDAPVWPPAPPENWDDLEYGGTWIQSPQYWEE